MTGNELKELRQKAGLRQVDVAEKLGISYQSYQRYEKKKDNEAIIPAPYFSVLAELFNQVIDAFIPRSGNSDSRRIATADRGSSAIIAGGDVAAGQQQEKKFSPKEVQAMTLKKYYDPSEILLSEYIEKLLKIKSIHEG